MLLKIYLIDVNNLSLDILLNSQYISPLEKMSFDKYKVELVKKEKIASSYLKNKYIGEYYLNEYGKPISNHKCFNISHSHGLVALVVDEVNVGIDIEKIRPVDENLKKYISNEIEKECIKDDESFYMVWTNKEALTKAYGTGIKTKPDLIPALPFNGIREYNGNNYYNKSDRYKDYVVTISRLGNEDYSLQFIKEVI